MKLTARFGTILLLIILASCTDASFYGTLGDKVVNNPVVISPAAPTLIVGSSLTFSASGGMPPYSYSIVSGTGTVNRSTGLFNATTVGTVKVQVTDKNNSVSTATATVTATPHPDYSVISVTNTGATTGNPGGPITGNFQFKNISLTDNGTQTVVWTAYASTSNVLDGSAMQIASGTAPRLAAGVPSAVINFGGQWPLHFGFYFLLVSVTAPEALPVSASAASAGAATIGYYTESEPNGDYATLAPGQWNDLGITLKPGMSVQVTGILSPNTDLDDIFGFNTGTANNITFFASWSGGFTIALEVLTAANTFGPTVTGVNAASLGWVPGPTNANATRWIDINNTIPADMTGSPYTLIISAN